MDPNPLTPTEPLRTTELPPGAKTPLPPLKTLDVERPGSIIGNYKLLEQIGEGGFGVVYLAEQCQPLKRRVALKIIKLGMDTREVIARFEAERQALALMDHPNVARVLDAGATDSGRPYFVMELVKGLPITDFCDRNRLTPRKRIELFISVCRAAQHAHSKGIIHRDLKPSNILVTMQDGTPVTKIIDFGIAKAIEEPLTEKTLFTHYGQTIGTPVYMSPEQTEISAVDVDTRSDVYSLGVVLYELLTSKPPFDAQRLSQVGRYEMMRIIRDEDPPRPSTRLTTLGKDLITVAQRRHVHPRRLTELVRGDLDWITMKCLQKERSRRYETAAALAEDLQRHLEHRPVRAGPPSLAYRSLKFVQRHSYAVAMFVWMLLALTVGLALSIYLYVNARTERESALAAERRAEQQRQFALAEARRAQANEERTREISYASDMALATHALSIGNLGRAQSLLARYVIPRGATARDLRGWEWRYLWKQCQSAELFQLGQLSNGIITLSASLDGHLVLAADLDGNAALWDLPARSLLWVSNKFQPAILSPDGKLAVDWAGRVHEAESGWVTKSLPNAENIKALAFTRDGSLLAGLTGRDRLSLWEAKTWALRHETTGFPCASLHFGALAFDTKNQILAVGTEDGTVQLLEVQTGNVLRKWQAHQEGITSIAFSGDARFVLTSAGYADEQIKIWSVADGRFEGTLGKHEAWVSALAFSPSANLLASSSADQSLAVWDFAARERTASLRGNLHEVWTLAFLQDGKLLLSGAKDGAIKVWRVPASGKKAPSEAEPRAGDFSFLGSLNKDFCFTLDGDLLALQTNGAVQRWALPAMRPAGTIEGLGNNNYIFSASPELRLALAVEKNGTARVWDFNRKQIACSWELSNRTERVIWIGFAPAASQVAAIRQPGQVEVRNAFSGELQWAWSLPDRGLGPLALSPEGKFLACGGRDLSVYNLTNGALVTRVMPHKTAVDTVAFSPDGKHFATGSQDGLAKLWRTEDWQEIGTLRGHLLGVHATAFSPDGRRLATGSVGKEAVKVWDLDTLQEVLNIAGNGQIIFWLGFSPDSRGLLTLGTGGPVQYWSAPLLQEIQTAETGILEF